MNNLSKMHHLRFRFGLRTLLILTTLAGLLLGRIVKERSQSQRELQLAEHMGNRVHLRFLGPFDVHRQTNEHTWWKRKFADLIGPIAREARIYKPTADEIAKIAGFQRLHFLELSNPELPLAFLADFTTLKELGLHHLKHNDFSPIASLHQLERLEIRFTPVSDVRALSQLKNLSSIWLAETQFKDFAQLTELRALKSLTVLEPWETLSQDSANIPDVTPLSGLNLEWLAISINPATNLEPICRLASLQGLFLDCEEPSKISAEKIRQLQATLSNCTITVGQMHGFPGKSRIFKPKTPGQP